MTKKDHFSLTVKNNKINMLHGDLLCFFPFSAVYCHRYYKENGQSFKIKRSVSDRIFFLLLIQFDVNIDQKSFAFV